MNDDLLIHGEGCISVGQAPESWGFNSERFMAGSYLWRNDGEIVFSFVATTEQGRGFLSHLRKAIEAEGLSVAVPTPFPQMQRILKHWGFVCSIDDCPEMGPVEVWRAAPRERSEP